MAKTKTAKREPRRVSVDGEPRGGTARNILLALGIYLPELHYGIARFGRDHNWHIPPDWEDDIVPRGWSGDGVLALIGAPRNIWRRIRRLNAPVVEVSESRPEIPLPRVSIDNVALGRMAAEYFLNRGYRNFAFVQRWELGASRRRRDGFTSVISAAGFDCNVLSWGSERGGQPDTSTQRLRWLARRLSAIPKPLAVFGARDDEAVAVIDACLEAGLAVPDEVSVMGAGNSEPICECLRVPLSSIEVRYEQVGYEGAALLQRLMDGKRPPKSPIYIPPGRIIERRSTDSLAVEHDNVAAALRFIHGHSHEPINMTDVIRHVRMSRSGLEKAFREHYIRAPIEELRHVRLARAKKMLLETDEKIIAVAWRTGFRTSHNLCRAFSQEVGLTPKQYRLRQK